ncbi:hypothetical protein RUND412_004940 [Rhizina undulata]
MMEPEDVINDENRTGNIGTLALHTPTPTPAGNPGKHTSSLPRASIFRSLPKFTDPADHAASMRITAPAVNSITVDGVKSPNPTSGSRSFFEPPSFFTPVSSSESSPYSFTDHILPVVPFEFRFPPPPSCGPESSHESIFAPGLPTTDSMSSGLSQGLGVNSSTPETAPMADVESLTASWGSCAIPGLTLCPMPDRDSSPSIDHPPSRIRYLAIDSIEERDLSPSPPPSPFKEPISTSSSPNEPSDALIPSPGNRIILPIRRRRGPTLNSHVHPAEEPPKPEYYSGISILPSSNVAPAEFDVLDSDHFRPSEIDINSVTQATAPMVDIESQTLSSGSCFIPGLTLCSMPVDESNGVLDMAPFEDRVSSPIPPPAHFQEPISDPSSPTEPAQVLIPAPGQRIILPMRRRRAAVAAVETCIPFSSSPPDSPEPMPFPPQLNSRITAAHSHSPAPKPEIHPAEEALNPSEPYISSDSVQNGTLGMVPIEDSVYSPSPPAAKSQEPALTPSPPSAPPLPLASPALIAAPSPPPVPPKVVVLAQGGRTTYPTTRRMSQAPVRTPIPSTSFRPALPAPIPFPPPQQLRITAAHFRRPAPNPQVHSGEETLSVNDDNAMARKSDVLLPQDFGPAEINDWNSLKAAWNWTARAVWIAINVLGLISLLIVLFLGSNMYFNWSGETSAEVSTHPLKELPISGIISPEIAAAPTSILPRSEPPPSASSMPVTTANNHNCPRSKAPSFVASLPVCASVNNAILPYLEPSQSEPMAFAFSPPVCPVTPINDATVIPAKVHAHEPPKANAHEPPKIHADEPPKVLNNTAGRNTTEVKSRKHRRVLVIGSITALGITSRFWVNGRRAARRRGVSLSSYSRG